MRGGDSWVALCPVPLLLGPCPPWATQASPLHSTPLPHSRVGFSCSRLGSPTRLSPPLLLPLTFFLFLFGFAWRFLMRGQLTGPWFCPKTAYRTALLLKQGHQDQPYALSKTTRESWPRLLGGDAPGNMLLRQASSPLHVAAASASPPTLTTHNVATAMTTHKRAA